MSNRDSGRDPRRRGRSRQGAGPSQPPPAVVEDEAVVSPDRIPSQVVQPQFAGSGPRYDPRFQFPYFDSSQVRPQQLTVHPPRMSTGDIPSTAWHNLEFWETYGRHMPWNHTLFTNLLENAQQTTGSQPPQAPPQNIDQQHPSQPPSQATQRPAATQTQSTTKVFIEPEGDT